MNRFFLVAVLAAAVACSTGCAGLSQVVAAKEKSDKVAVEAANDNIVEGIKDATCLLPYGTLLRHPEMQVAAKSICGTTTNAATLLPAAATSGQ